ncbi:right-handed parallel beta-helix repeat-containing protein [Rapidithrix thailandica]|uniref:Right-handed parallel beta-helix repeat-containing protein n=1 Tax=Rapidithrix thailandica TaxID=413964 RepID=A0AAW9S8C3_9BACT
MNKYKFFRISIVWLSTVLLFACEPEEESISTSPDIKLSFSQDTIFFDTVFTTVGSVTKRLSVTNPSNKAVNIANISLGNTQSSAYAVHINGISDTKVENVKLLGGDSLLVLVEVFIDPQDNDLPFIVQDSLVFETNGNVQDVKLISWGQDANFYRSGLQGIDGNTTWTANRPYVIFDSVLVQKDATLTIEEGTRIYMNPGAYLFVNGTLKIQGVAEKPVTFQGVRQEKAYAKAPGQWGGIFFLEQSHQNEIYSAIIKNATVGIHLGTPDEDEEPDLVLANSIIENMAATGIQCFTSDLLMYNTLIDNCIQSGLACWAGGNYVLYHNTIANYQFDFFRETPSLILSNYFNTGEDILREDLYVDMRNTIVWGVLNDEVQFFADAESETKMELNLRNNIFKTQLTDFLKGNDNQLNTDPKFTSPIEQLFTLDTLSPAKDKGQKLFVSHDLLDNARDENPDIGAYERIE